ncbi:30S ribosomal protein S20 [Buchnera aphidicola]|uniref:30S ribosomal protein S20 n=1 Tax=Buchnera aphidicola TaxID=9 RepID=UPI0030EEF8EB
MANLKSSKKYSRYSKNKRKFNIGRKSRIKNCIKKINFLLNIKKNHDFNIIKKKFSEVQSIVDKGALKRIIHKKKASRIKSSLTLKINRLKTQKIK